MALWRALGELCRDRWRRATNQRTPPVDEAPANDPWPRRLEPDITGVDVAIARTDPGYVTGKPVEEIRELYVDAISSAQHSLYLENQYFSSSVVGAALAARLREPEAPEVVVVSRLTEEDWLEEQTMGVLRSRLHKRMQEADVHGRYRLLYPYVPNLERPNLLNVHSKVLIMDDDLCSVGSANFNNRSMGFDTECNVAIEARGEERTRRMIARLRDRLLAEHLGTQTDTVASEMARKSGSLIKAINTLKRPGRTLEPINPDVPEEIDSRIPASAMIDPERPVNPEKLVEEFVPPEAGRPLAERVVQFATVLLVLGAAAAVWRWTPLHDWIDLGSFVKSARAMANSPVTVLSVLAVYLAGGLVAFPVTILIAFTGVIFGPILGVIYALVGSLFNAAVTYGIGRALRRDTVRRLAGSHLNAITLRLTGKGILTIVALRLLPIAPFSVVNAVAGASRVNLRDFLLGTAIGMTPGIILIVVFVDQVGAAVTRPGPSTYGLLGLIAAIIVGSAIFIWRRFHEIPAPADARS